MTDVLTTEQRRLNMSRIRGRDTKPEMLIRRGLHSRGLRYRLQDTALPGRPDLVFPRYQAVILVHGCFWHWHDCRMFRMPATRPAFWEGKLATNRARDANTEVSLLEKGWRVLTVWECSLKGTGRLDLEKVFDEAVKFIHGSETVRTIEGKSAPLSIQEEFEKVLNE